MGDTQTSPSDGNGIPVTVTAGVSLTGENFVDVVPTGAVSGSVTATDATPIVGATVYVDVYNSNTFKAGDPSTTTDSNGDYTIANVPAGAQTIDQVLPAGDTQTSPSGGSGIPVTVAANGSLSDEDFVDALPITGSVSGAVTTDNAAPIAGVTVYVDIDNSSTFDGGDLSATTDANGDYTIVNVPAGPQSIDQVLPTGAAQASPVGGTGISVNVAAGGSLSNENFVDALATTGSVSGSVTTGNGGSAGWRHCLC